MSRSSLAHPVGLLTGKAVTLHGRALKRAALFQPENYDRALEVTEVLARQRQKYGKTPAQGAIAWLAAADARCDGAHRGREKREAGGGEYPGLWVAVLPGGLRGHRPGQPGSSQRPAPLHPVLQHQHSGLRERVSFDTIGKGQRPAAARHGEPLRRGGGERATMRTIKWVAEGGGPGCGSP